MSSKTAKEFYIFNLPCGGQFPKKEITQKLRERIKEEQEDNPESKVKTKIVDVYGTNGGYDKTLMSLNGLQQRSHILIGWSMGGTSSLLLANQFDNVEGIVLLGANSNGYKFNNIPDKKLKILQIHNKYDSVASFDSATKLYKDLKGDDNKNHTLLVSHEREDNCHQYNDVNIINNVVDWIMDNFIKS